MNKCNATSLNALLLILMKKMYVHEHDLLQNKIDGFSAKTLSQILHRSKELLYNQKFPSFYKFLNNFLMRFRKDDVNFETELVILDQVRSNVDESWLMQKAQQYCSKDTGLDTRQIAEIMHELKSESKLITLFSAGKSNFLVARYILHLINVLTVCLLFRWDFQFTCTKVYH